MRGGWQRIDPEGRERGDPPWDGKTYLLWWNMNQPEPGGEPRIAHWYPDAGGLWGARWQETYGDYNCEPEVATDWMVMPDGPPEHDLESATARLLKFGVEISA